MPLIRLFATGPCQHGDSKLTRVKILIRKSVKIYQAFSHILQRAGMSQYINCLLMFGNESM